MGENIGAAARAMKNFGINDLRIINPRDGWPNAQAIAMSVGAADIINSAKIYDNLDQAIADLNKIYATTAQVRDMNKRIIATDELKHDIENSIAGGAQNIGIIFGRESSGLNNREITRSDAILSIPTTKFSSLNLGQAICVICYELFKPDNNNSFNINPTNLPRSTTRFATKEDKEYFYRHLFDELEYKGFFKTDVKIQTMKMKIRNIFERIDNLTSSELQTLRGIITNLVK